MRKKKELTEAERGVSDAQLEGSKAQTDLSAAQRNLSRLHITAPFTGKLIPAKDSDDKDVSFRVGEQVSEGQVIGYMVNDRQMKLTLAFSAEYARSIRTGQSATVSIASAMSEVSGTVSSVETAQQISSEGVRVIRVGITVNNPGSLTKGMTATATINTGLLGAIYPANAGTLEYSREEAVTAQKSGEIIKQNGKFGIRLKAAAPSIHMMRTCIRTEVTPIVGSEQQSEDRVLYLLKEFEETPSQIWGSNIFGKSLHELVNEGMHNKLARMPEDARGKVRETIERIINDGCNGLICIIL